MKVKLGEFFTNQNTTTEHDMTLSSGTWTYSQSLAGNTTRDFYFHVTWNTSLISDEFYKDQNAATMTYDHCTNWTFEQNSGNNPKLATVIAGSYTFSFTYGTTKTVSVTYPKYAVSASREPTAAANVPTVSVSSVSISGSTKLTAQTANTGYEFVKWEVTQGTVKTGSYASGTAITESTTNPLTVYPYGTGGTVKLKAVYKVAEYNITYKPGSAQGISGSQFIEKKQYNVTYYISDKVDGDDNLYFSRPGYTQEGWSTSENATSVPTAYQFGHSYTTNAARTLYPVWSIDAPEVSANNVSQYVAGSTAISLASASSAVASTDAYGLTATMSFALDNTAAQPTGGDATITNGNFYATVPGIYTIKMTGTVTAATNTTTNGSASDTTTFTVTVVPDQPEFTITLDGWSGEGDGSAADPWKILLGTTYYFSAAVDNPVAGLTYSWSKDGTTWNNLSGESDPYANATVSNSETGMINDEITFGSITANQSTSQSLTFTLWLKAERNGQSATADAQSYKYKVQPLIETFKFQPIHKIYDEYDESVSVLAEYNLTNPTGYTTTMYFSKDMNQYIPIQTETGTFISSFDTTLRNYLYPAGVKYFKMQITKGNLTSTSDTLHTTVGARDMDATKPFYFIYNISGSDLVSKRVMAFWADSDSLTGYSYQTAQDVNLGIANKPQGVRFRVNLPEDAEDVIFAVVGKDSDNIDYYGMPTYSSGVYSFSTPYFTAMSEKFTPTDDQTTYTATAISGSGVQSMTGSLSGFVAG